MKEKKIVLVQPSHIAAPLDQKQRGHIYLPNALLIQQSRVMAAGGQAELQDANFEPLQLEHSVVGVNAVGSCYIPSVMEIRNQMVQALGSESKLIVGGQVITALSNSDDNKFRRIFKDHHVFPGDDSNLKRLLGLDLRAMPAPESTSLIPALQCMPDAQFAEYFRHEFCLYLSQGCKEPCSFCAAKHTIVDAQTGKVVKKVKEQYRDLNVIEDELQYMVTRALPFGITCFDIYLSNLDLFQTPDTLLKFARVVQQVRSRNPGFTIKMRGLSTVQSFMKTYRGHKDVIREMVDAGLWSIGFGVDGSPQIWNSIRKGFNDQGDIGLALQIVYDEFSIIPEMFMLFGHYKDTPDTIRASVSFCSTMIDKFPRMRIRPYVAKCVPGSEEFNKIQHREYVEQLVGHPWQFKDTAYETLATALTHPDPDIRQKINEAYIAVATMAASTTHFLYPTEAPELDEHTRANNRILNVGKYDR